MNLSLQRTDKQFLTQDQKTSGPIRGRALLVAQVTGVPNVCQTGVSWRRRKRASVCFSWDATSKCPLHKWHVVFIGGYTDPTRARCSFSTPRHVAATRYHISPIAAKTQAIHLTEA
jgi:hypothetical protein